MPSRAKIDWRGDELVRRVRRAAVAGVNETVDAARDDAKATHPWKDDPEPHTLKSGRRVQTDLERQIVSKHADPADPNPTGSFGTTRRGGFYGLFHEEGTEHEFARPFLRPAADREFPTLAARIRQRLAGHPVTVGEVRFEDE